MCIPSQSLLHANPNCSLPKHFKDQLKAEMAAMSSDSDFGPEGKAQQEIADWCWEYERASNQTWQSAVAWLLVCILMVHNPAISPILSLCFWIQQRWSKQGLRHHQSSLYLHRSPGAGALRSALK